MDATQISVFFNVEEFTAIGICLFKLLDASEFNESNAKTV